MREIAGTAYEVDNLQIATIAELADAVEALRSSGKLDSSVLGRIRNYFRIKNIYHSNAIEGNQLDVGETRLVVEQGLTITGKPLKDQAEAKNLSEALDFLEELSTLVERPITEVDIRQLHFLVLKGIHDEDAGSYRKVEVEISGSKFKPPVAAAVADEMERFSEWMSTASIPGAVFAAKDAILVAAAAHTWFVTIHPFIDGNGRVGRLLMNVILMRFGYPIGIITQEDRLRYYDALETSQVSDLTPFVSLLVECVRESLEEYEKAAEEQREALEWARSLASKFDKKATVAAENTYEVWKGAMELLKSIFKQNADMLTSTSVTGEVYFRDFGTLEFEKYLSLKNYGSAKKTWFFRLDFRSGSNSYRYLFFFGSPSYTLKNHTDVTLHLAREDPPGSFHYEKLDGLNPDSVPDLFEVGYAPASEDFVVRGKSQKLRRDKVDQVCRKLLQGIIEKHFVGS